MKALQKWFGRRGALSLTAYLAALEELDAEKARLVTDDCSLFELTGRPVQLTQGDYANLKITTREDLPRPQQKEGEPMRIGHGYDVHRLVEAEQKLHRGHGSLVADAADGVAHLVAVEARTARDDDLVVVAFL